MFFAPNDKAWKRLIPGSEYPEDDACVIAAEDAVTGTDAYVITINERLEARAWDVIVGAMAHECVHVLQFVEERIGSDIGIEGQAYLVQDMLMWLMGVYEEAGRTWADASEQGEET